MRSPKVLLAAGIASLLFIITFISDHGRHARFQLWDDTPSTPDHRPDEKYLTFYPHSGLHNQRVALLNAVILAKALDRTLILPMLNLGRAVYWWPSPLMEQKLSDCPELPVLQRRGLCSEYRNYVPVNVTDVFDLSALDQLGIRYIQRRDMTFDYWMNEWGVAYDDPAHVYRLDDNTRFSYRIFDTKANETIDLRMFKRRIDLEDLATRPERFLNFGSLFSTFRLQIDRPDLYWLREYLGGEIGFSNANAMQQTLGVVGMLGGPGAFASVHLRTGDGMFKVEMARTMDEVRHNLESMTSLHRGHHEEEYAVIDKLQAYQREGEIDTLLNECVSLQHNKEFLHPRLRLIFMATDTAQPRQTVPHFFEEFVCLFTLSDFSQALEAAITSSDTHGPLLLPLIDAEVAAHGSFFVGTKKSTFSKYIKYRNRRFLSLYPNTIDNDPSSL
ncbi:hypothetical protein BX666DRAFT_1847980 [Dichotomocladium elegans]|nr:hypothetical protein BX666DRAFT_1847980 [Dichotomocladium elegans]